ncbi:signal peptidase I [Thermoclostridium stercorarium]|uniref:signal peptidase I n=1 Tax=Thermoclostridium stercorarium TaxID=1510 RepID=UPI001FA778D3|nr:signal peptidase I [Thermoclostridium stercorarium]
MKKEIIEWLVHIALAIIVTLAAVNYICQFTIVKGNSMLPTLQDNNILVIEKLSLHFGGIKPGDIVVLRIPDLLGKGKVYAVKRVIATEGQKVEIKDGKVFVDGEELQETYTTGSDTFATGEFSNIVVPENCIYVLGDNRLPGASKDSRTFGPLSEGTIIGKVVFRLYPFSEIGPVE